MVYRKMNKSRQLLTVNVGADTSTYSISFVAIDYILVIDCFYVFGRGQRASGAATWHNQASFFFTTMTDASFKRFMPGIVQQWRRDITRRNYDILICAFAMFNSNCTEGSQEGGYSLWLKFYKTLASTLLPGDGGTTLVIFNRVFLSTHLCLEII